ncbi:MAG: hypothetical protein ACLPKB_25610 [Xanthobacteraceae bacterium]
MRDNRDNNDLCDGETEATLRALARGGELLPSTADAVTRAADLCRDTRLAVKAAKAGEKIILKCDGTAVRLDKAAGHLIKVNASGIRDGETQTVLPNQVLEVRYRDGYIEAAIRPKAPGRGK